MNKRTRKFAIHYEYVRHGEERSRAEEDLEFSIKTHRRLKNVQITIEYEAGEA